MIVLTCLLAVVLLLWTSSGTAAEPAFADLPAAKALAVPAAHPHSAVGLASGETSELAASVLARQRCEQAAPAGDVCEIVRLNDVAITTAAEIRARVPEGPHPLFLWRYQRGGTVLYLAGSIHVLKQSLYPLPRQFDDAFELSDVLVLEVNLASLGPTEIQRRTLAHARLPEGQSLTAVVPPRLLARLRLHMADFAMTPQMMSWAKPAMVMNQIVVGRLLTLGYLPDSGLEDHFLSRRGQRRVLQLESLDAQLRLLFDRPMDAQIQLLSEALATDDRMEPLLADLVTAWLSGQDGRFLELFEAQSGDSQASRAFLHDLLDERNVSMAHAIEGFLDGTPRDGESETRFVLVGAAHLVGEHGIVQLLARDGIRGERVHSDQSIAQRESAP